MASTRMTRQQTIDVASGGIEARRALADIRAALVASRGRIDPAAKQLKCGSRTLRRWLRTLELQEFAADLRAKAGVPGPREPRNP